MVDGVKVQSVFTLKKLFIHDLSKHGNELIKYTAEINAEGRRFIAGRTRSTGDGQPCYWQENCCKSVTHGGFPIAFVRPQFKHDFRQFMTRKLQSVGGYCQ